MTAANAARRALEGFGALWLGPDQWLLTADAIAPSQLIERCAAALGSLPHHAVDLSDAFECVTLRGQRVRELLAMGSAVSWDPQSFPPGACIRTRFAQIAVIAHAVQRERVDLYYDRSYRSYLERWLAYAASDPSFAGRACRSTS